jgi:hypothetical protein
MAPGAMNSAGTSASSGGGSWSPTYTQISPARSATGKVRSRTLPQIGESGPSVSAATSSPVPRS